MEIVHVVAPVRRRLGHALHVERHARAEVPAGPADQRPVIQIAIFRHRSNLRRFSAPGSIVVVTPATIFCRKVRKAGDARLEAQPDLAGRAVALLGDDHLGEAMHALHLGRPGRVRLVCGDVVVAGRKLRLARRDVIVFAVDEPHHVGVLLDRAGFAQIRQHRALVLALFDRAAQLRERDDRELQQLELDLNQSTITATADGTISKLNLRNPGQTVRSGEEIAQIVPSDVPLVIKAAVPPQDKSKLKPGQKVQMRVSACAYTDYGTLKGVVSEISEDTIKPQANSATATAPATASSQQGGAVGTFYEEKIKPDVLFIGKGKNQCPIQVGMEGRADIISKEETVLQFLLRKAKLLAEF